MLELIRIALPSAGQCLPGRDGKRELLLRSGVQPLFGRTFNSRMRPTTPRTPRWLCWVTSTGSNILEATLPCWATPSTSPHAFVLHMVRSH